MKQINRLLKKYGIQLSPAKLALFIFISLNFYGVLLGWIDNNSPLFASYGTYHWYDYLNPLKNLRNIFTPMGFCLPILAIILFKGKNLKQIFSGFMGMKQIQDSRGFTISENGRYGTAQFMQKKEIGRYFEIGSLQTLTTTIFGRVDGEADQYSEYVGIGERYGFNSNICVIGASGSGKSRGFVEPFILQAIRRNESIVIVDPKGIMAQKYSQSFGNEYCIRYFNLVDMMQSDSWNPLVNAKANTAYVWMMADTILQNCGNRPREDFWVDNEKSLLASLIHMAANMPEPGCLGDVYKNLTSNSHMELDEQFRVLLARNPNHPAKSTYSTFGNSTDTVKQSVATGLASKLAVFQNPTVDSITRYNEIDIEAPGKQKCAYFIILPDNDRSLQFISSLFFSLMIYQLTALAGRSRDGKTPVKVNLLLDEVCNIGIIPSLKENMATVRSKNIAIQLITQSLPQLMGRYPEKEWEDLLSNADTMLFLGCNDQTTAEYISSKGGETTIYNPGHSSAYDGGFSHQARRYTDNNAYDRRKLIMPDEVYRLPTDKCLVFRRGCRPLELFKITPEEHPNGNQISFSHDKHIPNWRKAKTHTTNEPLRQQTESDEVLKEFLRQTIGKSPPPFDL